MISSTTDIAVILRFFNKMTYGNSKKLVIEILSEGEVGFNLLENLYDKEILDIWEFFNHIIYSNLDHNTTVDIKNILEDLEELLKQKGYFKGDNY